MVKNLINSKYMHICGVFSFVLYALSFFIGHEEEAADHLLILVKIGLIAASSLLYLFSCTKNSDEKIKVQYSFLSLAILVFHILLILSTGKTVFYIRDYPAITCCVMWYICSLISVIRFRNYISSYLSGLIKDRDTVILAIASVIISAVVILLSAEPNGIMFTWDSNTLYGFIYEKDYEALYDAKQLLFDNHISIVYMYLLVLLKLLIGNIRTAFFLLNMLCIIAASFGMTFLIKTLVPGKKNTDYIIGNLIFMLSPWVLGMSTYHIYDYYIWCLFPLLIFFYARDCRIGFFVIGAMISFSRSPGLIIFGSICAVSLIREILVKRSILPVFKHIRYYLYASVALVFFVYFLFGIDKSMQMNDTVIGIDKRHILHLVKLYTTTNFLWIYLIIAIIGLISILAKKNNLLPSKSRAVITVLVISDIVLFVFYCVFITYRLPRYMDSHIAVLYICAIVFLLCIGIPTVSYTIAAVLTVINMISSFRTVDPISKALFRTINVGDHLIVDFEMTETPTFRDSMVCNREYYSYEVLLNKALTYVINDKDKNDGIIFSLGTNNRTWGLSGGRYSYIFEEGKHDFEMFYDLSVNGLANGYDYSYYHDENIIPFEINYLFPNETVEEATSSKNGMNTFYYIYMPTINASKEEEISGKFDIIDEQSFNFRGWQMNCIKFKR